MASDDEDTEFQVDELLVEFTKLVKVDDLNQVRGTISKAEDLLGLEQEDVLNMKTILAYHYRQRCDYKEAEELDREVYAIRLRVLGPDHIDIARAMDNLAVSVKGLGRFDEGVDLEERALRIALKVAGEDSATTHTCMSNLANSYNRIGRFREAAELHEKVLQGRVAGLGEQHRLSIMARDLLASDYSQLDRLDEAIELQEEALQIARDNLGEANVTTLKVSGKMSALYGQLNTEESERKAQVVIERAYKVSCQMQNQDEEVNIYLANNLAVSYANTGRLADAQLLLKVAYEWNRDKLGDEHPQTQTARSNYEQVVSDYSEELELLRTDPLPFAAL